MSESLRRRLMEKTANLAEKVEAAKSTRTPVSEQPFVTMPGQLGAFRLEARRYQDKIDDLTRQLEEARAMTGSVDVPLFKAETQKTHSVKIKKGRNVYCELRQAKNLVRLEFPTEAKASAMCEELKLFLETRAKLATPNPESSERLIP